MVPVLANWHPSNDLPEEGQMYMTVILDDLSESYDHHYYLITRYKPCHPLGEKNIGGWWDVTQEDVWYWIQEGRHVMVLP